MRFRKTMSVIIAAAMLTSTFCAFGASAAEAENASTANSVDTIVLDDFTTYPTYSGSDLGSTYTPASTTFKVWAPSSTKVTLNLYKSGNIADTDKISATEMTLDKSTGVWSVTVEGDIKNTYYTYEVVNANSPDGVEVCDIYAKAAGVNGNRAMVVDLDSTDPEGWNDDNNFQRADEVTDANVWEVHIKDFSYDPESGVSDANRGKYLAFTELETTLNNAGNVKTCVNYLKDLGIKYVQINPMYDFGSVDEAGDDTQFNWGYDPKNYNVPEGSYSSDPTDGNVRINEMKQMIKALHDNGIGVIMDVVYNHTYESQTSWFNYTVPNYYYRQNEDGSWSNGSGCGNDTASEREMFKKFMVESVTYWANEYHIDGFRFDLMGLHDLDTMNLVRSELDKIDSKIITYGEGWNLGTTTDTTNWAGNKTKLCKQNLASKADSRIGFFNDSFRDSIKGKAFDDLTSRGFVSGSKGMANDLYTSISGQRTGTWKAVAPTQNVLYSCCHDNQTLWDRLVASEYGTSAADEQYLERNEQFVASNKLSGAITFTSQGIPFVLAGEEFSRTKLGDHNSYKSAADLNMLDWSRAADFADVVSYYKGMIQIRNNFDAFSDSTTTTGNSMVKLDAPEGVIAYSVPNLSTAKNQWSDAVVYFNASNTDAAEVTLPGGAVLMGDVDGDGNITSADSLSILRRSVGLEKYTDEQEKLANVNGDKAIDSADALSVLRMSVKLEDTISTTGTEYVVIANDQTAGLSAIETVSGKAEVQPTSALILVPKDSYDKVGISDNENARVVVNHIDKATNKVLKRVTIKGSEGQAYTTQKANDLSLEYDLDSTPSNASGKMTKGVTEVNYYYNLFAGGVGTLTVKYVDENGKSVASSVVTKARAGTEYTTSALNLTDSWYELVKTPSNASGKYTKDGVEVVYTYKYNKPAKSENLVDTTVHVKLAESVADTITPCLYYWDDEGKKLPDAPGWPGYTMEQGADGWYSLKFQTYKVYNWIVNNNGGSQTSDRAAASDIWIVISGSDLSKAENVTVYTSNPDK